MNGIIGFIKTKGLGKISLDMEDDAGELHHLNFHNIYYLPSAPKLLIIPQTWVRYRGKDEIRHEETYLNVMGKLSVLVLYNLK